jgi:hypothetical protein
MKLSPTWVTRPLPGETAMLARLPQLAEPELEPEPNRPDAPEPKPDPNKPDAPEPAPAILKPALLKAELRLELTRFWMAPLRLLFEEKPEEEPLREPPLRETPLREPPLREPPLMELPNGPEEIRFPPLFTKVPLGPLIMKPLRLPAPVPAIEPAAPDDDELKLELELEDDELEEVCCPLFVINTPVDGPNPKFPNP